MKYFCLDNKKVVEGSHKDPKTCISWVNTFNIVDDGKLVVCEGYHITLSPGETLQDKLQMKVLRKSQFLISIS